MISLACFYKVEAVEGANIRLTVAQIRSHKTFPPTARDVLSGLLTGWRMLFTGHGYRDLPLSGPQARALYLAAPSFERLATLYANYCPHNETLSPENYQRARSQAEQLTWNLGGRSFAGLRHWISPLTLQHTYGAMAPGHIHNHHNQIRDETETLMLDFTSTPLGGAGHPAALLSFRAGSASLTHFLRPGMVWQFTDEFECPHCLTNASYHASDPTPEDSLPGLTGSRLCQCSLCGGSWSEALSIVSVDAASGEKSPR